MERERVDVEEFSTESLTVKLHCQKCDWEWDSRTENPKKCPSCQNFNWHSDDANDALSLKHLTESVEQKRAEYRELVGDVKAAKELVAESKSQAEQNLAEAQKTTEGMVEDARVQANQILEDAETKAIAESKALLLTANLTLRSEIVELEQKKNALSQEILIVRNDADAYAAKTRSEVDILRKELSQKLAIVQQIKALFASFDFQNFVYGRDQLTETARQAKKLAESL